MPNLPMTSVPYPTAFLPTSIASLVLWLDGTDPAGTGTAPSNGASVSTWIDKSGNGNNATANGTPATYNTNAIVFAGAQNYGTSLSSTLLTQSAFAVISYTGSTFMDIISVRSTGGSAGLQQIINNGSQVITAYGGGLVVNGSSVPANTIVLYNYTFNSGVNAFIYLNGTQTGTSTGSAISGSGTISIGSYDNRPDAEPFVGNMYELVLFNTVLGTTDRRNVEGYLAQKYGITASLPVGHPGLTQTLFSATPLLRSLAGITSTIRITSIPYFTTFNPINLGNLALWLDASQDATANGVSIASLVDRSGNGNSLTPSGTITAATNFLRGRTVYNFGSSRASKTNFPWQTSFTQIVLVKCNTGNWLSSLVSGGAYLAYIFAGNDNLINVNNFFNPTDSSKAVGTSVFTYAADGVSSWIIFSIGYQSNATTASNYTINGTVRTSATSTAVSSAISATNQLWLNGNGSSTFDSGTYVAEMMHYNAVLSGTQRQQVESYLAQKWGLLPVLPVGHLQDTAPAGMPTSVLTVSLTNKQELLSSPITSTVLNTIATYLRNYMSEFRNPSFYGYALDGNSYSITDGAGDMYDTGNWTYPWLISGTQYTGASGSQQVFSINYSSTTATTVDTDFVYVSLGYTQTATSGITSIHPLTVLGFRTTTGRPVGFQLGGNSGADGSGTLASGILYAGDTIQGFTVHAFYRETYAAGDPSHCNLFILLGHPSWGSVFGTINSFADPVANGGNGCFFYTSGAGVSNILAIQTLLSKAGGALVTSTECQTVVQAFVNRVKLAVGF